MLAARFHEPGDVRVEEVPDPEPGPGDVVIRVRNCSVCGADRKTTRYGHHRLSPPRVLGHEIAGEVVSAGAEVTDWAAGDSVQVIAAIPCGACRECQAGHATVCTSRENMGYQYDGGFAEFMLVPAKVIAVGGVNRIPDGTGFAEASLAEPLACVLNAQELCGVTSGDEVLIIGDGPARWPRWQAGGRSRSPSSHDQRPGAAGVRLACGCEGSSPHPVRAAGRGPDLTSGKAGPRGP